MIPQDGNILIPTIFCIPHQYWVKWYFCSPNHCSPSKLDVLVMGFLPFRTTPLLRFPYSESVFPLIEFSPLGGLYLDVPLMRFFLLETTSLLRFSYSESCCWDFPHSEDCVCTLRWWDFSHSETATHTCLHAFSWLSYGNPNLPLWGFHPLRVPALLQGFPLLEPLFVILLMGFLEIQTLAYGIPSSDPWVDESQAVSLCRVHARSPLRCWDFPLSE